MLCLTFTFRDDEKIILELADGQKIELRHFRDKSEARKIGIEAPKDVKIYKEKR